VTLPFDQVAERYFTPAEKRELIKRYFTENPNLTQAEVGRLIGITRERVRQLCRELDIRQSGEGLTASEYAHRHGYSCSAVTGMIRQNELAATKVGKRWIIPYFAKRKPCPFCGRERAKRRKTYCSQECLDVAQDQSHRRAAQRWRLIKKSRIWVCPRCGRVYLINTVSVPRIDGIKLHVGDKEYLIDVKKLGEPNCLCGQPLGKEGLPVVEGLRIEVLEG
jgi:hypothetical protein